MMDTEQTENDIGRIKRIFKTFRTNDKIRIDSLEIEPIHVDHSVPGAYGFVIHTSEGPIVYTGDFRMHGLHSERTKDFICRRLFACALTAPSLFHRLESDESPCCAGTLKVFNFSQAISPSAVIW